MKYTTSFIFIICLLQISFYTQRHEFATLFATYAVFFATYLYVLIKTKTDSDLSFFLKFGVLLRLIVVFSFPQLSDDIYRFIWDGHLINLGQNPFNHPPQYFAENQLFNERLTPELFSKLNSPNYYSVYPSVCQAVFAIATFIFPKSIYGAAVVIKLFLLTCEVGTIKCSKEIYFLQNSIKTKPMVREINFPTPFAAPLIYALNPLIIIELVGNAHFEGAMIFFFIFAIYLLQDNLAQVSNLRQVFSIRQFFSSAAVFALSVVSKMLPLMFLPLFFKKLGLKRSFYFWIMVGILTLTLLVPIYNSLFISNISKSLGLYFGNFEFNASIFYLWKAIGFWQYGYNIIQQITPFLTVFVVLFILKKSFFEKNKIDAPPQYSSTFFNDCLLVISLYFACATTVHPWYAALPLMCSVFTNWRFPIVWTFFIFLTYAGYTEGSSKHTENMPFLIIEYSTVYTFFIFEWIQKRKKNSQTF
jgi:alpha-1,6-mannosyltransferase